MISSFKFYPVFGLFLIITIVNSKQYKSHRCLDWNFGGWSPMLYNFHHSISPIYHRQPIINNVRHINSANYVKKINPNSWLPFYTKIENFDNQAKLISYNIRKPSNLQNYPQYLPTTILRLKSFRPNKNIFFKPKHEYLKMKSNTKNYPQMIYQQKPILIEQIEYSPINLNKNPFNNGLNNLIVKNYENQIRPQIKKPIKIHNKPSFAAYLPIVQVPPNNYKQTFEFSKNYNIPKNYNILKDKMPKDYKHISSPKYPIEPFVKNYGFINEKQIINHSNKPNYIEHPKTQITYEISNHPPTDLPNKIELNGPPILKNQYQMENYAKAEDAGLFKPLLEKTRKGKSYKIIMPYKDNDPENLNVIHLIANQKKLPMIIPINSIHVSTDGSYPKETDETPVIVKSIYPYSDNKDQVNKIEDSNQYSSDLYKQNNLETNINSYSDTNKQDNNLEVQKQLFTETYKQINNVDAHNPYPETYKQVNNLKNENQAYPENYKQVSLREPILTFPDSYKQVNLDVPIYTNSEIYKQNNLIAQNYNNYDKQTNSPAQNFNEYDKHTNSPAYNLEKIRNENIQQEKLSNVDDEETILKQINDKKNFAYEEQPKDYRPVSEIEKNHPNDNYGPLTPLPEVPKPIIDITKTDPNTQNYQNDKVENYEQNDNQKYITNQPNLNQQNLNQLNSNQQILNQPINKDNEDQVYEKEKIPVLDLPKIEEQYKSNPIINEQNQKQDEEKPTEVYYPVNNGQNLNLENINHPSNYPNLDEESLKEKFNKNEGFSEYGLRKNKVPASNYEYVRPSNLKNFELGNDAYTNQQSYDQPIEYKKNIDSEQRSEQNNDQEAIRLYEEARKSILPPNQMTESGYQPPLTHEQPDYDEKIKTNTYQEKNNESGIKPTDIVGISFEKASNVNLPSSISSEKVSTIIEDSIPQLREVLIEQEQNKKNDYQESNNQNDNKKLEDKIESFTIEEKDYKTNDGSNDKYGERLIYVKSPKFKSLNVVNGDAYLGDTLVYSASVQNNTTDKNNSEKSLSDIIKTDNSEKKVEETKNLTEIGQPEVKQTRSAIRRYRVHKSRKQNQDKFVASASENISSFVDANNEKPENIKASDSQLFHAYYGPPDHKPPEGYVRLTIKQFKEIFKDAEIHVLNQNLQENTANLKTTTPNSDEKTTN